MADGQLEIEKTNKAPAGEFRVVTHDQTSSAAEGNDWWHDGDFNSSQAALAHLEGMEPSSFVTCVYDDAGEMLFQRYADGDVTDMRAPQFNLRRQLEAIAARQSMMLMGVHFDEETFTVTFPEEPCFAMNKAGRRALERGQTLDPSLWRWAAGGGLMVLDCLDVSAALVRYRDKGAPSHGDTYTPGSGLASSVDDMVNLPKLALRELGEETPFAGPNGFIVPVLGDAELDAVMFSAIGSARSIIRDYQLDDPFRDKFETAPAAFMPLSDEREITITSVYSDLEVKHRGLIVVDRNTRGIDFLKVLRVQVSYNLDELQVFDGEEAGGKSLNSIVGALRVDGNRLVPEFVQAWQGGKTVPASFDKRAAPVLQALFNALD